MLEGANQYNADGHGPQDATKGIRLQKAPPILNIHLKRFAYDPIKNAVLKVSNCTACVQVVRTECVKTCAEQCV